MRRSPRETATANPVRAANRCASSSRTTPSFTTSSYENGVEAVTTCPNCKERALPDHRTRLAAGDSFLAQIYGKRHQQSIQTKTDVTINVVSRLGAALERATAAVELNAGDVTEIEAA